MGAINTFQCESKLTSGRVGQMREMELYELLPLGRAHALVAVERSQAVAWRVACNLIFLDLNKQIIPGLFLFIFDFSNQFTI